MVRAVYADWFSERGFRSLKGKAHIKHRLFIALWPDGVVRQHIAILQRRLDSLPGSKMIPQQNLHITLCFLGDTESSQLIKVQNCIANFTFPAVSLKLDTLGYLPEKGLVWLRPKKTPPSLSATAQQLSNQLSAVGCSVDRRAFKAHVTLARNSRPAGQLDFDPINWAASDLVLVESKFARGRVCYTTLISSGAEET